MWPHKSGTVVRYDPKFTANEYVVQPITSALYELNDWKLTTSTRSETKRHADRAVNRVKPCSRNNGRISDRIALLTTLLSTFSIPVVIPSRSERRGRCGRAN